MRVIPAIDIMDGQVVRLYRGDPKRKTTYHDDPVKIARRWEEQGADMIHVVDLDATLSLGSNIGVVRDIIKAVDIPVQAAGGLRDIEAVSAMLKHAQRVVIGTLAFVDMDALGTLTHYGERLVVSVDHNNGSVMTHGWQQDSGAELFDTLERFGHMGITEFLITNVSTDGTLSGPDTERLRKACCMKGIHVIASGGVSDMADVISVYNMGAWGIILGRAIYDDIISVRGVVECLRAA